MPPRLRKRSRNRSQPPKKKKFKFRRMPIQNLLRALARGILSSEAIRTYIQSGRVIFYETVPALEGRIPVTTIRIDNKSPNKQRLYRTGRPYEDDRRLTVGATIAHYVNLPDGKPQLQTHVVLIRTTTQ